MTLEIEKNIAIPPISRRRREIKYRFAEMQIGDSLFDTTKRGHSLRNAASQWAKDHGVKFTSRRMDGGVRVWRVA